MIARCPRTIQRPCGLAKPTDTGRTCLDFGKSRVLAKPRTSLAKVLEPDASLANLVERYGSTLLLCPRGWWWSRPPPTQQDPCNSAPYRSNGGAPPPLCSKSFFRVAAVAMPALHCMRAIFPRPTSPNKAPTIHGRHTPAPSRVPQ
jgi:hypothetical protein